ncbi:MAG TPA: STAS domain-containing protein [Candidatus Binatia bacterium]|nr:STAS domain-containing protein [Candidatus Binatia bacterium]
MSLQITTRTIDDVTVLDLDGRVVLGTDTEVLGRALQEGIAKGGRKLIVNMKRVSQVDTSGISTIVRAFVSMQRLGGKFVLLNLAERVRMVLDMTRLLNVIPNYGDEAEAIARLR